MSLKDTSTTRKRVNIIPILRGSLACGFVHVLKRKGTLGESHYVFKCESQRFKYLNLLRCIHCWEQSFDDRFIEDVDPLAVGAVELFNSLLCRCNLFVPLFDLA